MLLLAAIRDAAAKTDVRAIERYDELYLINKFQTGQSRFRLLPTQADRQSFAACVTREAAAGARTRLAMRTASFAVISNCLARMSSSSTSTC